MKLLLNSSFANEKQMKGNDGTRPKKYLNMPTGASLSLFPILYTNSIDVA